jgi:hypothetical protein
MLPPDDPLQVSYQGDEKGPGRLKAKGKNLKIKRQK